MRGLQLGDEPGPVRRSLGTAPATATRRPSRPASAARKARARPVRARATPTRASARTRRPRARTGPVACPTNNFDSGALCEFADGYCFPKGTRPVSINGVAGHGVARPPTSASTTGTRTVTWTSTGPVVPAVLAGRDAGTIRPRSSTPGRSPARKPYPQIQFETNVGALGEPVRHRDRRGLHRAADGAKFYPFWSLEPAVRRARVHAAVCVWNFGNVAAASPPDLRQGRPVRHAQRGLATAAR